MRSTWATRTSGRATRVCAARQTKGVLPYRRGEKATTFWPCGIGLTRLIGIGLCTGMMRAGLQTVDRVVERVHLVPSTRPDVGHRRQQRPCVAEVDDRLARDADVESPDKPTDPGAGGDDDSVG